MDLLTLCGLTVVLVGISGAISVDYFPTMCNTSFTMPTSHRLESGKGLQYTNNMRCSYTVTAHSSMRILATFQQFDLENRNDNGTCVDYVNLYDGENTAAPRLNTDPLCGTILPGKYNSTKSSITVSMVTDSTGIMRGFGMMFTAFHEGSCTSDEFSCNNSLCIANSLTCNGFDQCGDNSDEASCSTKDLILRYGQDHAPMIAGIVLGFLALSVIVAIIAVYVYKRNKWRRFLDDNDAEDDSIWEIESAYPVTQRYFKGNRGRPHNYNTLREPGEAQPAIAGNDIIQRDIDLAGETSPSNTNV